MKRATLFILFLLVGFDGLVAQIDSTNQDFFPLHVGNSWVYESYFQGEFRGYGSNNVTKDTIMPNGLRYSKRKNERAPIRITDSLTTHIYDLFDWDNDTSTTDLLGENFNINPGEEWISYTFESPTIAKMMGYYFTAIFGETVEVRVISHRYSNGLFVAEIHYSRKFGISQFHAEGGFSYFLVGAKIDGTTYGTLTSVTENINPPEFSLEQNYPNPFNPRTSIRFNLPNRSDVVLKVYNLLGQEVKTLVDAEFEAGTYSVSFDASDLPSGVYIYRVRAGTFVETKRMVLLK